MRQNQSMRPAVSVLLGALTIASTATNSVITQTHQGRYSGSNVIVEFPKGWEFLEAQNHRQVYGVPASEDRGGIYVNNAFEPSASGARAGLEKTHAKYLKIGQAKSDIQTRKSSKGTYIWFDFKAPVRKFETYTKGYMIFADGKAILVHTVRLDGDKTIGKEIDTILASVSER